MRDLSETTQAETEKAITSPFYLVEIVMATVTLRLSSSGETAWNGETWAQAGVQVDDLRQVAGGEMEGSISLPNTDLAASALVLADGINDRPCRIRKLYGAGPHAPEDAVLLFDGVCDGAPSLSIQRISIEITTRGRINELSPRLRWELFCNHIPPAGTVIPWGGEHFRLEPRGF